MNLRDFPHIQAALRDVLPIIPDLWQAVDEATTQARTSIDALDALYIGTSQDDADDQRRVYDPWYFPHTVRYIARLYLTYRGLSTEFELDEVTNSGLRVRYQGRTVRLRKATPDGGVPPAGESHTLQGIMQMILSEEFACTSPQLIFLWHATAFGIFEGLSVVFALPGRRPMSKMLGCVWLPNPAESGMLQAIAQQEWGDLDIETLGDLPIEPLTAEDDGEVGQEGDSEQAE